MEDYKELPYLI